jgi:hypothetical protein
MAVIKKLRLYLETTIFNYYFDEEVSAHQQAKNERGCFMPDTAYGTYRNGQIFLDTPTSAVDESRVRVVFLGKETKKNTLADIFSVLGPWEDERSTETIIAEMRNARISKPDIKL